MRTILLFSYLISIALDVCAIDSIEIQAGGAILDQHTVSNIQSTLTLNEDFSVDIEMQGQFHDHPLALHGKLVEEHWSASTSINTTAKKAIKLYQDTLDETLNGVVDGDVVLALSSSGTLSDFTRHVVQYDLRLKNLTGELPEVSIAFEGLDVQTNGSIDYHRGQLKGHSTLSYDKGLLAAGDLLLEPVAGAIHLSTDFITDMQHLTLDQLKLKDPGGLLAKIPSARINLQHYASQHYAEIVIDVSNLSHIYSAWLQPVMYDTALENIEIEGRASASALLDNGKLESLSFDIQDVSLTDTQGRFSVYELSSHLTGMNNFEDGELSISWQGAELYRLLLGQSDLGFNIKDKNLSVTSPFNIPVYNGELKVFQLSIDELQEGNPTIEFDGILTPVSLSALSSSMGWPSLDGSISGVIPSVRYENSGLKVDGTLLARAFDGTFKIQHLEISDLLSPLPSLSADFSVDQLDLEKLTRTFDFGRIEGKLSGHITGLNMVAWKAHAFDAFFYTPESDDSRHIISQRAVDNLTSLSGSDIGSVLSRSYLRFFENFRYDKLGVGCRLRNNICRMNGIEAASGSAYYIVKGGLLPPRLDIIGYSNEVDWQDLLGRLERVMSDNAPVIQ